MRAIDGGKAPVQVSQGMRNALDKENEATRKQALANHKVQDVPVYKKLTDAHQTYEDAKKRISTDQKHYTDIQSEDLKSSERIGSAYPTFEEVKQMGYKGAKSEHERSVNL